MSAAPSRHVVSRQGLPRLNRRAPPWRWPRAARPAPPIRAHRARAGGDIADDPEADFAQEIKEKTDAQVKSEIASAAAGATFRSESDHGFTFVSAKLNGQTSITQALVREKVASFVDSDPDADKPLASLYASTSTFAVWKNSTANCHPREVPSPEDCASINNMNAVLATNPGR